MKRSELQALAGKPAMLGAQRVEIAVRNIQRLGEGSPFAAMFQPDEWKAYVEFDICHSFPVVAGPSMEGSYLGYHPQVLANSHRSLVHKQTNLQHLIKAYDPERIARDRIIGAVVATTFPDAPEGGWAIPDEPKTAPCIHACAVVFKQAEGALEMLDEHESGNRRWSVSIEVMPLRLEDIAIYNPADRSIHSLLEAPDDMLAAVYKDGAGRIQLGLYKGVQLAFAFGGLDGRVVFQGVGYTPRPAEKEARLTMVRMSLVETPCAEDLPTLRMEAAESCFPGSKFAEFDYRYAYSLSQNWPSLWALGRFAKNLPPWLSARRGRADGEWLARRESFAEQNASATSLRGLVELVQWGVVGCQGMAAMKAALEAEKEKRKKLRKKH